MNPESVAVGLGADQEWPKVDESRSGPAADDPHNARWVAVCSPDREDTQGPEAKSAAIRSAYRYLGSDAAWRRQEGPFSDDGRVRPPGVSKATPPQALEMSVQQYRQMAGMANMIEASGGGRYVTFHLIVRGEPMG